MALPSQPIINGPGQRDLELAFIGRNLDARAEFTIMVVSEKEIRPMIVRMMILNFEFVTCHGPNYKLGGQLMMGSGDRSRLPPFNFIFVQYNAEERKGTMEFSNGE
jgi:hypothetical protein